jgi:hypothetical protein
VPIWAKNSGLQKDVIFERAVELGARLRRAIFTQLQNAIEPANIQLRSAVSCRQWLNERVYFEAAQVGES